MKFFKNVEAASLYHVSEKSVRNWIESTQNGKLDLELYQHNGRHYLANTTKNHTAIKKLVERGQKFKNSRVQKTVSPRRDFYELYGPEEVFDIFASIDIHREIPLQYTYFNGGAQQWDAYSQKLILEDEPNILTRTIELLKINREYIARIAAGYKRINVVDLGLGNALPVREFLDYLLKQGFDVRYIGIDTSEEMLKIADTYIRKWFGGNFVFEKYILDISREQFRHVLADDAFDESVLNIVLLLGGTITNFRDPSHAVRLANNSMGRNDILIYSKKLDSNNARRYFDFYESTHQPLSPRHRAILDLLKIEEAYYEVEQFFDHQKFTRFISVTLKVDLKIEFTLGNRVKSILINKGESIILWRALHQTDNDVINNFNTSGFSLLHASKTPDQEYLLTISKVKSEASH